jgi:hypothetical protein
MSVVDQMDQYFGFMALLLAAIALCISCAVWAAIRSGQEPAHQQLAKKGDRAE